MSSGMNAALAGLPFDVVAFLATVVIAFVLLDVAWCREQVKKDLRARGCGPIHVRWHPYPFGYWAGSYCRPFKTVFVDPSGCIQSGRCKVLPLSRAVVWVSDDYRYLDERLPRLVRILFIVLGFCFVFFGLQHLYTGSLTVPGWMTRRGRSFEVQGASLYLLATAGFFGAANLFTSAFFCDMSKRRQWRWTLIARWMAVIGWALLWASLLGFAGQAGRI